MMHRKSLLQPPATHTTVKPTAVPISSIPAAAGKGDYQLHQSINQSLDQLPEKRPQRRAVGLTMILLYIFQKLQNQNKHGNKSNPALPILTHQRVSQKENNEHLHTRGQDALRHPRPRTRNYATIDRAIGVWSLRELKSRKTDNVTMHHRFRSTDSFWCFRPAVSSCRPWFPYQGSAP